MMSENQHDTKKGLKKIIDIAFQMNGGGKYRKISKQYIIESLESSETIRQTHRKV